MSITVRDSPDLELLLLRQGITRMSAGCERCRRCHRSPLVGERVYEYASGVTMCELCRAMERGEPVGSHLVHTPEFGHTLRVIDRRGAVDSAP